MKTVTLFMAGLFAIIGSPVHAAEAPQCGLKLMAELPVDISHGALLVKLQVDGHDGMFLVDTGSPYSMLSKGMVDAIGLKPLPITPGVVLMDAAGHTLRHYVRPKKLMLNAMAAEDKEFAVMGEESATSGLAGVFGANFLAAYDVELDMPHGKIRLFSQDHCKGQVVYWTPEYDAIPFAFDASLHVVMHADLDGHSLPALLDTGASPSTLSATVARRDFDFDPAAAGVEPEGHVLAGSGAALPYYSHRFANLTLSGVEFHNTELEVIPDKVSREMRGRDPSDATESEKHLATPLVVGIHHLARVRAYIAYNEHVVYFSAADAK